MIATPRFPNTGYELLQGEGIAVGKLLGGCIDVFPDMQGTPLWPSPEQWKDKILLIETSQYDMAAVELTWRLRNLCAQGIIGVLRGIIVGKPAVEARMESYRAAYRQVIGFEANRPDLPILFNVNVGHAYPTGVFPLGLKYEINCARKTLRLLEPATM